MSPYVSFIMPAYNVERFIGEAVESVQTQTFKDWELIIMDDGSTDRTSEIAEALAAHDNRIRLLKMEKPSGGAFMPRKVAAEAAKADIIAPLDADDMVDPDYLEKLLTHFSSVDVDAVFPVICHWDGKDTFEMKPIAEEVRDKKNIGKDVVKFTLDGWKIHCAGGLIRKKLYLDSYSEVEEVIPSPFMDEYLTRLLLYKAKTVAVAPVHYYYRYNPDSVTHNKKVNSLESLMNTKIIEFVKARYDRDSEEYLLAQRQNFHGMFDAMRIFNSSDYTKDEYRQAKGVIMKSRYAVDRHTLRGKVSNKYYLLNLLPFEMCIRILKIIDKWYSSKKAGVMK